MMRPSTKTTRADTRFPDTMHCRSDGGGVGIRRLARQLERVADEIGEVLDFGLLVIMREDDGVAFLAEALDFGAQVEAREILADGSSHGISLFGLALAHPLHRCLRQGN